MSSYGAGGGRGFCFGAAPESVGRGSRAVGGGSGGGANHGVGRGSSSLVDGSS